MADIYRHIGKRVREERTRRHWTQEQLAERTELHLSFVGQLERGINKPSLATVKKLADVFGIMAGDLFGEGTPVANHGPQKRVENLLQGYSSTQQDFLYKSFRVLARQFKKFPQK